MQICVAVHEHKYGSDTQAFESEEGALGWRTEIAKKNWENEFSGKEAPGDDQIADEYFRLMGERIGSEESFSYELLTLELAKGATAAPALTVPSVHLNGTSREELLRQVHDAGQAVWQARDALAKSSPNARDYYPQGELAYPAARAEHDRRARALLGVQEELEVLAEAISDA